MTWRPIILVSVATLFMFTISEVVHLSMMPSWIAFWVGVFSTVSISCFFLEFKEVVPSKTACGHMAHIRAARREKKEAQDKSNENKDASN